MNYADGRIISREQCAGVIERLPERIAKTLAGEPLRPVEVVQACDRLGSMLSEEHALLLMETGMERDTALRYLAEAKAMLRADYLRHKLATELGSWQQRSYTPPSGGEVQEQLLPLGVLFHIAAGNVDALPAYSIIEGLLTGNINIAKLPGGDNGLSVLLLDELVRLQPRLAEYIYVFDYSSNDSTELAALAEVADGIVVWGGDKAVSAARQMAKANTRIIEWGHKLSFAYAVPGQVSDADLLALAGSMVESRQLLCSSCQGLYVDTYDMGVVYEYAKRMLRALDGRAMQIDMGIRAQVGLAVYTEQLEGTYRPASHRGVLRGDRASVIACEGSELEPAIQFGNCWVKPLPRERILPVLKPYKNHLQTAALLCIEAEREQLQQALWRAGVVRISGAGNMSAAYCGMPHDGEYTLRRYTRVVCAEY